MSTSGTSNVNNCSAAGQRNKSKDEPVIKFPPFYRPHPKLRSEFRSLLKSARCRITKETIQDIKALAKDHGLYVATWIFGKKGERIEGIILLENKKKDNKSVPPDDHNEIEDTNNTVAYGEADFVNDYYNAIDAELYHAKRMLVLDEECRDFPCEFEDHDKIDAIMAAKDMYYAILNKIINAEKSNPDRNFPNETNWLPIFLTFLQQM